MLTYKPMGLIEGKCVVAIGNFDGVHCGHIGVLKEAKKRAGKLPLIVLTFSPHPTLYFHPDSVAFLLSTTEEKGDMLSTLVDHTVALPFDSQLARSTAKEFVQHYLIDVLHAEAVFVGEDFRFGKNRSGSIKTLKTVGDGHFETIAITPIKDENGSVISSSRIREYLRKGTIENANRLLGHPYVIEGEVVHGEARGRNMGFPTANLRIPKQRLRPGPGIYATYVNVKGEKYKGATYIGTKPTFHDDDKVVIETFLVDFDGDLYGDIMSLSFIKRVRGDQQFADLNSLIQQIKKDVDACKNILN